MSDRRRRRRINSDEDSEESSVSEHEEGADKTEVIKAKTENHVNDTEKPESEYESAEEEDEEDTSLENIGKVKSNEDDVQSPADLIDEEGGEEGIADAEEVAEEFLDGDVLNLDASISASEEEEYVEEERQQGDGEECSPNTAVEKELDFDEDRRNPQYIPKKGTFYEHDDRNNDEDLPKEKEVDTNRTDKKKKKLWLDEGKWGHDRYREEEQTPKCRDELIEAYGYDIRCEDGPPRARRRRRYGRGPTKYERNWKDEAAYGKERGFVPFKNVPVRGGRGRGRGSFRGPRQYRGRGRKFIRSESSREDTEETNATNTSSDQYTTNKDSDTAAIKHENGEPIDLKDDDVPNINADEFPALPSKEEETVPTEKAFDTVASLNRKNSPPAINNIENSSVKTQTFENSNLTNKPFTYEEAPRRTKTSQFQGSYKPTYKRAPRAGRGRRFPSRGSYSYRSGGDSRRYIAPRLMEKRMQGLTSEIERLSIDEKNDVVHAQNNTSERIRQPFNNKVNISKQGNNPVTSSRNNADSSNRPKRYSSLRQRSLPETSNYQPTQVSAPPPHPSYYDTTYQGAIYTDALAPSSQPQNAGSPTIISPAQYQTYAPTPYPDNYGMRVPVNPPPPPPPRLFPQVTIPGGQTMLPPPPPSCIAPNPNLINFAAPPPPPPSAYPHFTYPQYPVPPPPPPPPGSQPDIYQGGITYYCTQSQPPPARLVPQKRPKAAIPIVPPPEVNTKMNDKKEYTIAECSSSSFVDTLNNTRNVEHPDIRTEATNIQSQTTVEVES